MEQTVDFTGKPYPYPYPLTVSHPQDQHEQEAQSVANRVINMTAPEYSSKEQNSLLDTAESNIHNSNLENQLATTQGSGNPLPNEVQAYMQPRFGADFSEDTVTSLFGSSGLSWVNF
ncbi:MAG: hypothetical protein IGS39_09185 [Calothrix sp. C42_A2020_038]|nr:hypothetical protein [Calothrix sp. C42_A2020_038]